jgi:hypothetical protein
MTTAELLNMARVEGLTLTLVGPRLTWRANHQPPERLLVELKSHKLEIIDALKAASEHQQRHSAWCISHDSKPLCMMIGEPMTYAEALEIARWRWPDAGVNH